MKKRRTSYASLKEVIEQGCPQELINVLWKLYRHGYTGHSPVGEMPPTNGTRLYVHRGYVSDEDLSSLRRQVDLGWENDCGTGQVSFDVMKFKQWLSLEDTTRLYFYKLKLNATETKKWRTILSRGDVVPYDNRQDEEEERRELFLVSHNP